MWKTRQRESTFFNLIFMGAVIHYNASFGRITYKSSLTDKTWSEVCQKDFKGCRVTHF